MLEAARQQHASVFVASPHQATACSIFMERRIKTSTPLSELRSELIETCVSHKASH